MNDDDLIDFEQRMTFAKGIRLAFDRVNGNSKLERCSRIGVTPYALDKWTAGVSQPSEEKLARLARVSGMDQETIRMGGVETSTDEENN